MSALGAGRRGGSGSGRQWRGPTISGVGPEGPVDEAPMTVGPMRAPGSRKTTAGTGRAGRGGFGLAAGLGWGLKGLGWSRS